MKYYKLVPQLRENCIIQGNENWLSEFKYGDTIFLISNTPAKKFSIISKIDGIEYKENPRIFIDKRNLGNFAEHDEVFILKYNPAEAIEIRITLSDEYSIISKGDWTASVKPSLINKLIDLGQELSFLIPWEGGAPIIATGIITYTLPNPPLYIGDKTKILIEKASNEQLTAIRKEKLKEHEERVDILETQIKQKTIEFIKKIKHQNYPFKGQKYQFKATNPNQLFNSVIKVFDGLEIIELPEEKSYHNQNQDYFASAVFLYETKTNNLQLVDLQIIANENSGNLIIWVTGNNEEEISETLKRYDLKILQLKQGLEQKVEVISVQCPECGGDLPINNIDLNGMVECIYCNKISKIPKVLRY
ncbi:MAG: hypothetical protein ACFFA8_10240 [Promethearchaeota archaeon]